MTAPSSTRFRLAVFDVAGTTVLDGDAVLDCLTQAVESRVPVSRQQVVAVMGLPKPVAIRHLLSLPRTLHAQGLEAAVTEAHKEFRNNLIACYRAGSLAPADGAETVFAALRASGVKVALDTGFSRDILDTILDRLDWRDGSTIDFSIASDEVERGRPHPDLIHRAMHLAAVDDAGTVVKIGDTPTDMDQGVAARCGMVVGVTYGTHTREQLDRPGVAVIDRLASLLPLIGLDAR